MPCSTEFVSLQGLVYAFFERPEVQRALAVSNLSRADVPGRIAHPESYQFWKEVLKGPVPSSSANQD